MRKDAPPPLTPADRDLDVRCADRAIIHINSLDCQRTYDREVEPGSLTGAVHHVALKCTGYEEVKGRLDAMGAHYKENLVSAISLRQIFTPDPNNMLLELNFFARVSVRDVPGAYRECPWRRRAFADAAWQGSIVR